MNLSWKKVIVGGLVLYGIVVLVSLLILAAIARFGPAPRPAVSENSFTALIGQAQIDRAASGLLVPSWSPALGATDARITIIQFADFQCPYSRAAVLPLRTVLADYPNDVRLVFRHFPIASLHPMAERLAESSMCAHDQGKFWAFHDRVYLGDDQQFDDKEITGIAQSIGLNMDRFERCLISGQFKDAVKQDFADAVAAGSRGTPTWLVNGKKVEGYLSEATWRKVIEALLK